MRKSKNLNTDLFINNLGNTAAFFLPFFIVLMISVACNTEHKSSMMKHILAPPAPGPYFIWENLPALWFL
jgi:ABC-type transport system involved in multi-copper enzyme maturation permease subunit